MKNKTRYTEYDKVLNDKQWNEVGDNLTINKWQGGLMLGGIFIFVLGAGWFVGKCIAYFVEYLW